MKNKEIKNRTMEKLEGKTGMFLTQAICILHDTIIMTVALVILTLIFFSMVALVAMDSGVIPTGDDFVMLAKLALAFGAVFAISNIPKNKNIHRRAAERMKKDLLNNK